MHSPLPLPSAALAVPTTDYYRRYPELAELPMVIALNCEYYDLDSTIVLKNNDELAFIPPISGGTLMMIITCFLHRCALYCICYDTDVSVKIFSLHCTVCSPLFCKFAG